MATVRFTQNIQRHIKCPDKQLDGTRTRDGGETFEALRSGLPQQDAWDVVYRHALAVDSTGDTLTIGSTTGNMWTTADGGDSWQQITSTLPPIYSIRFVPGP